MWIVRCIDSRDRPYRSSRNGYEFIWFDPYKFKKVDLSEDENKRIDTYSVCIRFDLVAYSNLGKVETVRMDSQFLYRYGHYNGSSYNILFNVIDQVSGMEDSRDRELFFYISDFGYTNLISMDRKDFYDVLNGGIENPHLTLSGVDPKGKLKLSEVLYPNPMYRVGNNMVIYPYLPLENSR